jgi:hypothetical protein
MPEDGPNPICAFAVSSGGIPQPIKQPTDLQSLVRPDSCIWLHFDVGEPEFEAGLTRQVPMTVVKALIEPETRPRRKKPPLPISRGGFKTRRCDRNILHPGRATSPFAFELFTRQFASTTDRFSFVTRFLLGGFLEMLLQLHFTKHAFAL